MNYLGDFQCGATVLIYFNTFDSNDPSASVTMTNFINTDVHIHKDDSLTQRNNAAGITVDVDVDAIAGSHFIKIDTADDTVADFFKAGHDYFVRIEGATVDAGTINAVVGHFSLENRNFAGKMVSTDIATLASQTSFTLTAGSADNDAYNGCTAIISDKASAIQKAWGIISDYVGSTKTVTLAADPGIFTMAAGDNITIVAGSPQIGATGAGLTTLATAAALSTVDTVVDGIQTDLDNGTDGLGAIKSDTAAILLDTGTDGVVVAAGSKTGYSLTSTTGLGNQTANITGNLSGSVGSVTGAVGSVTGAVGSVTGAVGSVTAEVTADVTKISGSATAADNLERGSTGLVLSTCAAGSTTTVIETNLTEATDDHYNGRVITWTSGALAGQSTSISDYNGTSKALTVVAVTEAPASTDAFVIS